MTIKDHWHNISQQTKEAFNKLFQTGRGSKLNHTESVEVSTDFTRKEVISIPVGPLKTDDLEVKVQNGYLIISAKKSWSENRNYGQGQMRYSGQTMSRRMIPLNRDISPQMVDAWVKNGQLIVSLPSRADQPKQSHRQIKSS